MAGRIFPAGGGRSIPLTKRVMVIGRAIGCDVHIPNPVVSNRHCALEFDGRYWTLQDLGSRNGTVLNSLPVGNKKQVIRSGDTMILSAKFRYVIEYDPVVERQRFAELGDADEQILAGDDRRYLEHGPATDRLEPHDKDVWSKFEK
jgi:pSer/pThr/pTyr-binding forkhead associated (FHA) protein